MKLKLFVSFKKGLLTHVGILTSFNDVAVLSHNFV